MSEQSEIIATIDLNTPVAWGGKEYAKLELRAPKGKDFRKVTSTGPIAMILELAGPMAEVPPQVIDKLDSRDVKKLAEVVGPFLS